MSEYLLSTDATEADYLRALRPIERLGLEPEDPVYKSAVLVVRRCRTTSSATGYGYIAARTLGWLDRRGIDPRDVDYDDFIVCWNSLGGLSPATRRQRRIILHALFKEFIRRGIATNDPTDVIAREPEPSELDDDEATPALTEEQVNELIAAIAFDLDHPDLGVEAHRDIAMIALMIRLCLRRAEVRRLKWGMFRVAAAGRQVRYPAKGSKARTQDVPDDVWDRVEAWRAAYERATGVVFADSDHVFVSLSQQALKALDENRIADALRPMALTAVERVVKMRLATIGISGYRYSPHCLRATGATLAFEGGANLVQIQVLLGHASIGTTRRHYLRRINKHGRPAMEKMRVRFDLPSPRGALEAS